MTLRARAVPRVYELGRRIAVGGMGEIYEGIAPDLARHVAIKRVLRSADDADLRELFMREVAVAATLEHPNVVEVIDAGLAGPDLFLVMEFVQGPSLADMLEAMRRRREILPIEISFGLLAQIARGLAHAHERSLPDGTSLGILHRDVAPENVLVTTEGLPKLADFGLAKLEGHEFTSPGTIRGRPRCLSPEQARGDKIDVRSDVFALGAMMFELVSGEALYPNEALATLLWKVAAGEYESIRARLPSAEPDLISILETALAIDPKDRFRSARDMERALDKFRAARGIRADSGSIARAIASLADDIRAIRAEKPDEGPGELEGRKLTLAPDRIDASRGTGDLPGNGRIGGTMDTSTPQIGTLLPNNPFYDAPTNVGARAESAPPLPTITPPAIIPRRDSGRAQLFEHDVPVSPPRAIDPWQSEDLENPPVMSASEPSIDAPTPPDAPAVPAPPPSPPAPPRPSISSPGTSTSGIWSSQLSQPTTPVRKTPPQVETIRFEPPVERARVEPVRPKSERRPLRQRREMAWLLFLGIVLIAALLTFAGMWLREKESEAIGTAEHGLLVLPSHSE